ncbi:MAG: hypothetical protein H0X33_13585 [Taibaiella sp.]|nr:hypothetical protein [Taibaiella sp.]
MLKKASILSILLLLTLNTIWSQTTYLPLNTEDYHVLDRLETRSGRLSDSLFNSTRPQMRSRAVDFLEAQDSTNTGLSKTDHYNIDRMINESGEWAPGENGEKDAKHPWFHTFYKKQFDLFQVHTNNFFLVVNPVISAELYSERGNKAGTLYWSGRGFEARGWIAKRIGFYTYVTDNQERDVSFYHDWVFKHNAVPGADYYIGKGGTHYDYLLAAGYFDIAIIKDHLNATFGYDKNFIGDGINSMFLSDFSAGTPFLRLITRIWKLNYENLYTELTTQHGTASDQLMPHKYATMHHLSFNATRWLNLGVFESVVFGRQNQYELRYLNPVIFIASLEQSVGSPDKKHIGIDFKSIAAKHLQFYGQFLLDEFKSSEFFSNRGWWGNKWAAQLGGKYFDAFSVRNLDLQLELNVVRPYTYTHSDTVANYTNYNQPLANPLGADFIQVIGIAKYQPSNKLYLTVKGMYYVQGADTGNADYGSNIFASYTNRSMEYGVKLINGVKTNCALLNLEMSYELRPNFFIDLGATHRRYVYNDNQFPGATTTYVYGGFRLNISKRNIDFY